MFKKHLTSALAVVCAVVLLGPSYSQFGPRDANGDQILPGGRAARIHSYFMNPGNVVLADPAPGTHGFIITDVVARRQSVSYFGVDINVDDVRVADLEFGGSTNVGPRSYHFKSGIVVPAGAELRVESGGTVAICGYEF